MAYKSLQLRPMGVGDLLDTAFRLYRRHFFLFVGIVAFVQVPLTFIQVAYVAYFLSDSSGGVMLFAMGTVAIALLNVLLVQGLVNGAMARAVYDRYLGQPLGLVDTYRAVGGRLLRLGGSLILLGLLDVCILLLFLIPCIGWLIGVILLVYINVPIVSFLAPVIVIENRGVGASLSRAFELGRRQFWRVLGFNILLWLLTAIISEVVPYVANLALNMWEPSDIVQVLITTLLGLVAALLTRPVWVCGLTLLYLDLRVRFEGYDLELMAQEVAAD